MPGILDVFAQYFGNPLTWVFLGIFLLAGVLIGVFLRPWMGNQVIKFSPGNHTFRDLNIEEESSISVQCKRVKGIPIQRFFKLHPGFTGIVGRFIKKPITRYLGMEGTAYTWKVKDGQWEKLGTLEQAVRTVWGEKFYDTVPEILRKKLEESRIQVTVGLDESPLTPEGMRSISEEDIKQEEDRKAAQVLWEEKQKQQKGMYVNLILAGGTGFGIALALMMIGVLRMPVITQTVEPEKAAQIVIAAVRSIFQ